MLTSKKHQDLSDNYTFVGGFPHDYFSWLRRENPVFWHEATDKTPDGEGFWVVSRYEDIMGIATNPEIFPLIAAEFVKEAERQSKMKTLLERF